MGLLPFPSIDFYLFFANHFCLINHELKTPSLQMTCLLGIQNEIQAVCSFNICELFLFFYCHMETKRRLFVDS